ncbi:MAG: dTDP-4-dehydrorhamnose 3,5-epimerase family protein [Oscillospiraceae bacterium]|nr:dTDP-4-dehydrorhamnose 3,5-epimerase family protein [Oscillospiraceae bacterium]
MVIKKSKDIVGVHYLSRNITQDKKGNRYLTYSWPSLFQVGIPDIFTEIYRKDMEREQEFHGLFYYPERSFLFRCTKGRARLFLVDMRSDSKTFLRCVKPLLDGNGATQTYIPAGFAWGILTLEENTSVQIHTTSGNGESPVMLDPFDSALKLQWGDEEILVATYDLPVQDAEYFKEV